MYSKQLRACTQSTFEYAIENLTLKSLWNLQAGDAVGWLEKGLNLLY
jgi:hypothetical protein